MLVFKILEITFSNFSLTWWELETLFCFLAWKQKFSFDHLSVDTRDIRQKAIIGRLMIGYKCWQLCASIQSTAGGCWQVCLLIIQFPIENANSLPSIKKTKQPTTIFQIGLSKAFFIATLGPRLLHVSWLPGCDDSWQRTGVLFDLNCSHWATSCFFNKREEGPQGHSPGKAAWNTPCTATLASVMQFSNSVSIQQQYSHLSVSLVNTPQENELDVWLHHKKQRNMSNVTGRNTCNRRVLGMWGNDEADATEEVIFCATLFK